MEKHNSFYTISLNSSIDNSFYLPAGIIYDDINRIKESRVDAGGKGLNVARMLAGLNCRCTALAFMGGGSGEKLKSLLDREGVAYIHVSTKGSVRSVYNFFSGEKVLRFNESGPRISPAEKKKFFALIDGINCRKGDILAISGSLPPGMDKNTYRQIIKKAGQRGFYTVLDTDGEALEEGLKASPDVIKPNLWELERIAGRKIRSAGILCGVLENIARKDISTVLLTLGGKGAILFSRDLLLYAPVPGVRVESTVGCGDAFLAGFLYGMYRGKPADECLRLAAASGTAKAGMKGTLMPGKKEIMQISGRVKVRELKGGGLSALLKTVLKARG